MQRQEVATGRGDIQKEGDADKALLAALTAASYRTR